MKTSTLKFAALMTLAFVCAATQAAGIDISQLMTPEAAMGLTLAGSALTTNYVQEGDTIQYTAGGTIAAGAVVVMGNTLGVALVDMVSGDVGSVAIKGVFTLPKASAAVIAKGESLTWDVSAGNFDDNAATPASGDITGAACLAFAAAAASTTTVQVKLTGTPGTKTA